MTPDEAAKISAEMATQREEYAAQAVSVKRLQTACAERGIALYFALKAQRDRFVSLAGICGVHIEMTHIGEIDQLLQEIES